MKVRLIKQNFKSSGYTTCGYKIRDIEYCCDDLKNNPLFEFSMENIDDNDVPLPSLREDVEEGEWGEYYKYSNYYEISFCPFCGKPIKVEVVGEEDVTEIYREIEEKRNEIHKKYIRTDSKKKEVQYGSMRNQLDMLLNYFHCLLPYETEDEIRDEFMKAMEK